MPLLCVAKYDFDGVVCSGDISAEAERVGDWYAGIQYMEYDNHLLHHVAGMVGTIHDCNYIYCITFQSGDTEKDTIVHSFCSAFDSQ